MCADKSVNIFADATAKPTNIEMILGNVSWLKNPLHYLQSFSLATFFVTQHSSSPWWQLSWPSWWWCPSSRWWVSSFHVIYSRDHRHCILVFLGHPSSTDWSWWWSSWSTWWQGWWCPWPGQAWGGVCVEEEGVVVVGRVEDGVGWWGHTWY